MAKQARLMDDHVLRATIETFRDKQEREGLTQKDEYRFAELLNEWANRTVPDLSEASR